jgi:hypothetical protein
MEVQTQLQTARSGFPTDHEALTNNLLDVADTCMAMMTRALTSSSAAHTELSNDCVLEGLKLSVSRCLRSLLVFASR